jgi:arylsulfatase A-like enzyme
MPARKFGHLIIAAFSIASAFSAAAAQTDARAKNKPNVVIILMDDLGYGDLGSYGVKDARTPNLDRLAREGVRFTDAYANGPSCSPTRAGLISGQYQQRYGIEWPLEAAPGDSARGLRRSDGRPDLYENTKPVEVQGYLTDEITRPPYDSSIAMQTTRSSSRLHTTRSIGRSMFPTSPARRATKCVRQLPANTTSAQVAMTMDLTASILGVTGTTIPAAHKLDGLNLLPGLNRRSPVAERQLFWRTKHTYQQRAVRSGRWKLLQEGRNFYLFDVYADPGERNDLTATHPDLVRKLNAALDNWEKTVAPED